MEGEGEGSAPQPPSPSAPGHEPSSTWPSAPAAQPHETSAPAGGQGSGLSAGSKKNILRSDGVRGSWSCEHSDSHASGKDADCQPLSCRTQGLRAMSAEMLTGHKD